VARVARNAIDDLRQRETSSQARPISGLRKFQRCVGASGTATSGKAEPRVVVVFATSGTPPREWGDGAEAAVEVRVGDAHARGKRARGRCDRQGSPGRQWNARSLVVILQPGYTLAGRTHPHSPICAWPAAARASFTSSRWRCRVG